MREGGVFRRRAVLKALPGAALVASGLAVGLAPASGMAAGASRGEKRASPSVLVVGAGIIGISIAYHLARAGALVRVVDKGTPGMGCTQGAFAMLIVGHPDGPQAFNALYGLAVADWRRLQAELPGRLPVQWGGTLNWAPAGEKAAKLEAERKVLAGWGVAAETVTPSDFARLCPEGMAVDFGGGSFLPDQGAVDVMGAFAVLFGECRRLGVDFVDAEVTSVPVDGSGRASLATSAGPMTADVVVMAAGAANTALAASAGVHAPIDIVSGTLAHSKPMPPLLSRVLNGPHGSVKQNPDGRIVTGLDYAPGADGQDVSEAYGRKLLATAARMVPALKDAELDFMTVGYVPIPAQGQAPILGFCARPANLYLAAMMSGVTMAPLMGRLAAEEVMGGTSELLAPWRPHRFNPAWQAA